MPEAHGAADDGKPDASKSTPADWKVEISKLDASVASWLALFVFGGGLLSLYYAGIDYFPEVSWQDALTYMALMTIIGGSLFVAYSFLLFVPGAIWSEFLICAPRIYEVLKMGAKDWEPCVWSVTKRIVFPFALFMAFCHFLLYLQDGHPGVVALGAAASLAAVSGLLGMDLREELEFAHEMKAAGQPLQAGGNLDTRTIVRYRWAVGASHALLLTVFIDKITSDTRTDVTGAGILWIAALFPLVSFAGLLVNNRIEGRLRHAASSECAATPPGPSPDGSGEILCKQDRVPDEWSLLCRAILAFGCAALLSLAALWFFYRIYEGKGSGSSGVPLDLLLLCTLTVIVTNLVVSVLFRKHRWPALLASFLASLLLLGAGELLGDKAEEGLPARIMANFGFGRRSVTLVLTEKGGRLLCHQAIPVEFEEREPSQAGPADSADDKDKSRNEGRLARAVGVKILSRLGSEYLVRFEREKRTVALPKKEVISWSTSGPDARELEPGHPCELRSPSGPQQDSFPPADSPSRRP